MSSISKEKHRGALIPDDDPPSDPMHLEFAIVCLKAGKSRMEGPILDPASFVEKCLVASGLVVERVEGRNKEVFLKVGAPVEIVAKAAEKLRLKKATVLGMEAVFNWSKKDVFVRQPNGQLFTWTERYTCLDMIINNAHSTSSDIVKVRTPVEGESVEIAPKLNVVPYLTAKGLVKETFPLHVDSMRRKLMGTWALAWFSGGQPLDDVYAYFGAKVAMYFAFLGMYTRWLWFIAVPGLYFYFTNWGQQHAVMIPPMFGVLVVLWGLLFLQFWRRRNVELTERWEIHKEGDEIHPRHTHAGDEDLQQMQQQQQQQQQVTKEEEEEEEEEAQAQASSGVAGPGLLSAATQRRLQRIGSVTVSAVGATKPTWRMVHAEWRSRLAWLWGNGVALLAVLFVQLPVEVGYHYGLHQLEETQLAQYGLTALYVLLVGRLTTAGGRLAIWLTKRQSRFASGEAAGDALISKVFGLYFLQSFCGLAYTAMVHRDFDALRSFLLRKLATAQVMNNISESLVPYATYRYNKFKARRDEKQAKKKEEEQQQQAAAVQPSRSTSDVERQYLMPSYVASIGGGAYDGLFDDFLELALQFGMVTMFACCFPLVGVFSLLNNLVEIRSDSFKLLTMFRRPVPHKVASIGSWFIIFQQLGVLAIISNCVLVVYMYDDGRLVMDPALLFVLVIEHMLLLTRYGIAWFIPEEPAWVKKKKMKQDRIRECLSSDLVHAYNQEQLAIVKRLA